MISLTELSELKNRRKTNLYYEEKEYLQYIFLHALSGFPNRFVFKGGTCLRICYGLERASEDLDFSTTASLAEVRKIVSLCLKDFELLNIKHGVSGEKEHQGNLRIEVRFEGPLFSGTQASTNTLKVDFNKTHVKQKVAKVVPQIFSDIPAFTIFAIDETEILAEKIRALANRSESRDLYDVWMLLSKGVIIDRKLLDAKLKEEHSSLKNLKVPIKQAYERDLKGLLLFLPPYVQVKEEVLNGILKGIN
ncbi:nucleotidyl transferase AbiEii/AbiGii toxin family protein [Candidatus Woesearchaeota archaeon]|nr:nucleotidyl transferase AbiEii/AbiGii toxin family protein [Candidatus Woesearchaeota archaeon]